MKLKLFYYVFACTLFIFSCKAQSKISKLDILQGTWKVENKETYEVWKKNNKTVLDGSSYKLSNGEKRITETLTISEESEHIVYKATVPNQNHGKAIAFTLNTNSKDLFSFENLGHDFPKKIQYKVISNDKLLVNVFGDNDEGFSYYLIRQ